MPVLPPVGELMVLVTGTVVAITADCGCCRGQKKYGCSGVSRWKSTENTQGNTQNMMTKLSGKICHQYLDFIQNNSSNCSTDCLHNSTSKEFLQG
jgi:hypothetical protein